MTAGKYNLTIEQGADFERAFTWKIRADVADPASGLVPVDLTGMSARMKIKTQPEKRLVKSLTDGNGITLGGSDGTIAITISAADTANMNFAQGTYDLELVDTLGKVRRLIQGVVRLSPETTD